MSPLSQPASFMGGSPNDRVTAPHSASMRGSGSGTSPTMGNMSRQNSTHPSQASHSPSEWVGPTRPPRDRGYSNTSGGSNNISERLPTPSPLAADSLEYFSETAAKIGGGTAASGLVIQSPDGRPAGIFFQPQRSSSRGSDTMPTPPIATTAMAPSNSQKHLERENRLASNGSNGGPGGHGPFNGMMRRPSNETRNPSKLSRTLSTASRPSSSEGPPGDSGPSDDVPATRRQRGITLTTPFRRADFLDEEDQTTPTSAAFPRSKTRSRPGSALDTRDSPSSPAASTPSEHGGARSPFVPPISRKSTGRSRADSASTIERRRTSFQGNDPGTPLSSVQNQNIGTGSPGTPRQGDNSPHTPKGDEKKPQRPMLQTKPRKSGLGDTPTGQRKSSQGSPLSASNQPNPTGMGGPAAPLVKGLPRKNSSDAKTGIKGKLGGITPPISVLIVEGQLLFLSNWIDV